MLFNKAPVTLVIPVIFWISGICAGYHFSLALATGAFVFVLLLTLFRILNPKYALLMFLIFIAGVFRIQTAEMHSKHHISNILEYTNRGIIKGQIVKVIKTGRLYRLKLLQFNDNKTSGNIRLTCYRDFLPGDIITAEADIQNLEGPRFPMQRDWRLTWKTKQIYGFGKVTELTAPIEHKANIIQKSRNWLIKRLKSRLGDKYYAAGALFIGDTSEISYEYRELLQRAGLSHLFAISGMHVGLIALFVLITLKLFFKKRTSYNISLTFLLFYGFICNWTPTVTRAIVMFIVYRLSTRFERPVNIHQVIAVSLFIITITSPLQIFSIGLQLSVFAVLIIVFVSDKMHYIALQNRVLDLGFKLLIAPIILAILIIIVISPLTISNFQSVSSNAIFGIIPAAAIISLILPTIIMTALLPILWQPVAQAYFVLLHFFNIILKSSANMPLHLNNLHLDSWKVLFIYIVISLSVILFIKHRRKSVLLANVLIILVLFPLWDYQKPKNGILRINCIDCGQGDMTFIELPDGFNLLIDTGPPDGYGEIKTSLIPWLQKRGIKTINYAVITHAHNDHYGGITGLFDALEVKCLVTNLSLYKDIEDSSVINAINLENCLKLTLHDTLSFNLGVTDLKFLYPPSEIAFTNVNNNSLVLQMQYDDFTALFTGDIEEEAEEYLVKVYGQKLKSDFLKVPHHGSISSSTIPFITNVKPEICFIPAGKNNRFGFPNTQILRRYSYLKDNLVIASNDGTLVIETDGKNQNKEVFLRK